MSLFSNQLIKSFTLKKVPGENDTRSKILSPKESNRFLKDVQNLNNLKNGQLNKLNIEVNKKYLKRNYRKGIF